MLQRVNNPLKHMKRTIARGQVGDKHLLTVHKYNRVVLPELMAREWNDKLELRDMDMECLVGEQAGQVEIALEDRVRSRFGSFRAYGKTMLSLYVGNQTKMMMACMTLCSGIMGCNKRQLLFKTNFTHRRKLSRALR